jgi:hypothetical protein
VPVGGALDAVPVYLAIGFDIGKPRNFRVILMAIFHQGVLARDAETTAEGGNITGAEILLAKDQYRMLGERAPDPGEGLVVELS